MARHPTGSDFENLVSVYRVWYILVAYFGNMLCVYVVGDIEGVSWVVQCRSDVRDVQGAGLRARLVRQSPLINHHGIQKHGKEIYAAKGYHSQLQRPPLTDNSVWTGFSGWGI